jgi:hypothetical protein
MRAAGLGKPVGDHDGGQVLTEVPVDARADRLTLRIAAARRHTLPCADADSALIEPAGHRYVMVGIAGLQMA